MRKILSLIICGVLLFSMTSCKGKKEEVKETEKETVAEEKVEKTEEKSSGGTAVEWSSEEVDKDSKELLSEISTEAAALPDPKQIESPDAFIAGFEKYADLYVKCADLDSKYVNNKEVFMGTFVVTSQMTDWTSKSGLGDTYGDPAKSSAFWKRYGECIDKMKAAAEKRKEAFEKAE